MLSVRNQIITMNRGDTVTLPMFINKGSKVAPERYVLGEGDTVYLGIMEFGQPFECALIRKACTSADLDADGDVVFTLEPKDTEFVHPGEYYYEVKLVHAYQELGREPFVDTICPRRKFIVLE